MNPVIWFLKSKLTWMGSKLRWINKDTEIISWIKAMEAVHKLLVEAMSRKELWEMGHTMNSHRTTGSENSVVLEKRKWRQQRQTGQARSTGTIDIQRQRNVIELNIEGAKEPRTQPRTKDVHSRATLKEGHGKKTRVLVKGRRAKKRVVTTAETIVQPLKNLADSNGSVIVMEEVLQEGRVTLSPKDEFQRKTLNEANRLKWPTRADLAKESEELAKEKERIASESTEMWAMLDKIKSNSLEKA